MTKENTQLQQKYDSTSTGPQPHLQFWNPKKLEVLTHTTHDVTHMYKYTVNEP